jgi:hypothetical protein
LLLKSKKPKQKSCVFYHACCAHPSAQEQGCPNSWHCALVPHFDLGVDEHQHGAACEPEHFKTEATDSLHASNRLFIAK